MKGLTTFIYLLQIFSQPNLFSSKSSIFDYTEKDWPQQCQIGKNQSPINLDPEKSVPVYDNSVLEIISSTYTPIKGYYFENFSNQKFALDLPEGQLLVVKKGPIYYNYNLLNIHFHFGSEHTIKGNSYDLELHLVHSKNSTSLTQKNITDPDKNSLLVIGIFFKASPNYSDNPIIKSMNIESLSDVTNLDLRDYVRPTRNFYHYSGSLTTPNCDELVNWVVMDSIEMISQNQFDVIKNWIKKIYPQGNSRFPKSLNERTVYYIDHNSSSRLKISFIALVMVFGFIFNTPLF